MMAEQQTSPLYLREQFRIRRLQVFNWGTFSGLHDIPIAEQGFLFVGRSGSGKSTLLDAFSALLTPPRWIDFNAAAREAERTGRDRNFVSYIRGAWAEQKDDESGMIATQYLRPGTTWSALALTYCNALGQTIVLVQVFWLRGTTSSTADVKRHFFIFERSFDLQEMADFDLDVRKLKQHFSGAFASDEFRPYSERFRRLLSIETEMALRLLHKTQSAKNLGDLNAFLRDFMLDRPATFDVADRLVSEFAELNAAHQAVVTARRQVQTLTPARSEHQRRQVLLANRTGLDSLRASIEAYREGRRMDLLQQHIADLQVQHEAAEGEISRHQEKLNNYQALLRDLEQQHRELGGDRIERLEAEKEDLESQRVERLRRHELAKAACSNLGWILPNAPHGFAELVSNARREIENWQSHREAAREEQIRLASRLREAEAEFATVLKEVEALKRQPSNIPAGMLELRHNIAAALRVSETSLPFAGELIEVRKEQALWQGAIERILRGFALSMLVDDRHYGALSAHVNATNLAGRLVYLRTLQQEQSQQRPISDNSLVLKLNVKESEPANWLRAELRLRFDYACVDSLHAFRNTDRALTREGQVRHGKSRHEKDDRNRLDDRTRWVLGFDNQEKRALFEERARNLAEDMAQLDREKKALAEQENRDAGRVIQCQTLANLQWQEIDAAPLIGRIADIDTQINEAREGNPVLREMAEGIAKQKEFVKRADTDLRVANVRKASILQQKDEASRQLDDLRQDPSVIPLTVHQKQQLDERFAKLRDPVRLDNLDKLTTSVVKTLNEEDRAVGENVANCEKNIENCFAEFKRTWPVDAGNMDATLGSTPDFLALLTRLETDGLPAHEQRFFDLLQNQSHQNLAALATHLSQARKAILERMELVNESLSRAEFNPGTHLDIQVTDRQLTEVREFKHEIHDALSHAWSDDRQIAESRFVTLQGIVERLASQDPEQKRWRECVLDVRYHVEFIGRELDGRGEEIEVYRSGSGKSGGQRQKLATTCLAAALRYQLGGNDYGVPIYAPVILDEAFDKADNEFTALSMNIFANFGFQMIVATPLKSVMTLEPFIGGACFIEISERRNSGVLLIEYDGTQQRLNLPEHTRGRAASETA